MALKALEPPQKVALVNGWELVCSEAGRSLKGLKLTVGLFNGTAQRFQTVSMQDTKAQRELVEESAPLAGLPPHDIAKAFACLVDIVEGALRQLEEQDEAHESQATRLVALALDAGVELFHTPDGESYATITVEGHKETWPLKVKGFQRWLARLFYEAEDKPSGSQAVQDALAVLEGKALFDGPECAVYTRLAEHNSAIYLDLADEHWQAVEITSGGWRVVAEPPVKFRRARGMLPLPLPVPGGRLVDLQPFLNIATDADWRLLVSWVVATLRPVGPYPVLVLYGEQGSAKSSLVRVLRSLIDPNTADLRTAPRDERDLVIAATNGWVIALDNLSHIPDWLSDALCRLATGSGFATRELYTDAEEVIFAAQRPIAMNGIEELATRGDLLDRALLVYLPTIAADKRQDEKAFWRAFDAVRPQILGALLDVLSTALRTLPSVRLERKPRMADFTVWACAAAPACGWTAEEFLDTYAGVQEASHELTLEASPVGPLVRELVAQDGMWEGTASALLTALELLAGDKLVKQQAWPKNGRTLSNALRRLAPTLRAVGTEVTMGARTGKGRTRQIRLTLMTSPSGSPAAPAEHAGPERVTGSV
jgi:hypothetical protein